MAALTVSDSSLVLWRFRDTWVSVRGVRRLYIPICVSSNVQGGAALICNYLCTGDLELVCDRWIWLVTVQSCSSKAKNRGNDTFKVSNRFRIVVSVMEREASLPAQTKLGSCLVTGRYYVGKFALYSERIQRADVGNSCPLFTADEIVRPRFACGPDGSLRFKRKGRPSKEREAIHDGRTDVGVVEGRKWATSPSLQPKRFC